MEYRKDQRKLRVGVVTSYPEYRDWHLPCLNGIDIQSQPRYARPFRQKSVLKRCTASERSHSITRNVKNRLGPDQRKSPATLHHLPSRSDFLRVTQIHKGRTGFIYSKELQEIADRSSGFCNGSTWPICWSAGEVSDRWDGEWNQWELWIEFDCQAQRSRKRWGTLNSISVVKWRGLRSYDVWVIWCCKSS
jgi:hypothetical protein